MSVAAVQSRYTGVAIALHWLIALAIIGQIASGYWMVAADPQGKLTFTVFQIHKSVGLVVLALSLARVIWRLAHAGPPLPDGMAAFERLAAHATHVLFYALMIAVPLVGWAMVSVSPTGVPTFFLLLEALPFSHMPLPPELSLAERAPIEAMLKTVHAVLAYATLGLLVVHVAAALKHQFVVRDNLLARMIPGALPAVVRGRSGVGVLAFSAAGLLLGAGLLAGQVGKGSSDVVERPVTLQESGAGSWQIRPEASRLGFTIDFSGKAVSGQFGTWSGDISFEPDALDDASATIVVDTATVTIDDANLSGQATGADGFDSAAHPSARFQASRFRHLGENRYEADGTVSIRGVSEPVVLTFTFDESDGRARVSGSATLDRLAFAIGAQSAADEAWLKHAVEVQFEIEAVRAD